MRRRLPLGLVLSTLCLSLSCAKEEAPQLPSLKEIPPNAFAVVGAKALDLSLLRPFEKTERKAAAKRVVRDALLGTEAEARGPARTRVIQRGEFARRLIEEVESEIRKESEVTETQLQEEYARRWLEFARPRGVRTVQIFFPVAPPMNDDAQYENAQRVLAAVEGTHNLHEFGEKAKKILDDVASHKVVGIPPIAADGRVVSTNAKDRDIGGISEHLAKAISKLSHAGEISPIVGTEDGYHVFFATEIVPAKTVPLDQVRDDLERSVISRKVERALDATLKAPSVKIERRRTDISNLLTLVQQEQ